MFEIYVVVWGKNGEVDEYGVEEPQWTDVETRQDVETRGLLGLDSQSSPGTYVYINRPIPRGNIQRIESFHLIFQHEIDVVGKDVQSIEVDVCMGGVSYRREEGSVLFRS